MEYTLLTVDILFSLLLLILVVTSVKDNRLDKRDVVIAIISFIILLSNTVYVWNHITP